MRSFILLILVNLVVFVGYSQPANDAICDAIELTVGASATTGDNIGATDSYYEGVDDPSCADYDWSADYFDVWYYAIVPDNGDLIVETSQASSYPRITDTGMNLYFGSSCASICSIGCNDDGGSGGYSKITLNNVYPGDTVWIRVWDYGCDDQGYFNIAATGTSDADITASANGDCKTGSTICSDENITANSTGAGNLNELNCSNHGELLGNEHYSTWLFFHAENTGTIEFTIHPNNEDGGDNDDYDFAIWSDAQCNPNGQPIRSSWAVAGDQSSYVGCSNRDIGYDTGIDDANANAGDGLDTQEGQCGDGWLKSISATAGDEFTMVIDNYTANSNSFTLTWTLTGGSSLDCNPLPVNYSSMEYDCNLQELSWETFSEINNDYFTIETGTSFDINGNLIIEDVYVVNGSGTTNSITDYIYYLDLVGKYVMLSQVDFDGVITKLERKYYSCTESIKPPIQLLPNPANGNSIVNIKGDYNNAEVFDMLGKKVNIKINNNQIIGLSKGLYFVKFDDDKPIKLIIQ